MNSSPNLLRLVFTPLVSFTGDSVGVEGEITFLVIAEMPHQQSTILMTFTIIQLLSTYYVILGWPGLNLLDMVISTKQLVRFLTLYEIKE